MRHVGRGARRVDKVRDLDVVVGEAVVARLLGVGPARPADVGAAGRNEGDELAEDGEFELELQAVHHALEGRLDDVEVGVFARQEAEVHDDDQHVDAQQLEHGAARAVLEAEVEQAERLAHVDRTDQCFLHGEERHLDLFHDIVPADVVVEVGVGEGIGAESEDGGRDVKDDGVDDDESEEPFEKTVVAGDEMEARPEHDALACDHGPPTNGYQEDGDPCHGIGAAILGCAYAKEFD